MRTQTVIFTIVATLILTCSCLYVINYFTVFGYYLPHKASVIYIALNDISSHSRPAYITITDNVSKYINVAPDQQEQGEYINEP